MRFQHSFKRQVGTAFPVPVLGSDPVPTLYAELADDNVLNSTFSNINGWPSHRIVIGYAGPAGAPSLTANAYVFDDASKLWFLVNPAPVALVPNRLSFFDIVGLMPPIGSQGAGGSGALEAYIQVIAVGGAPTGLYTFVVSGDLTAVGV